MYLKKQLKKRLIISIISVVTLVLTIVGTSYALFMDVKSNATDQVLTIGDLQVTFNGGAAIDAENIKPMTDAEAITQNDNSYSFTIDNTGELTYCFTVAIETNPDYLPGGASYNDKVKLLPTNYIRYAFNNDEPETLSTRTDGVVFGEELNPHTARLYTIRLWVGDATTYNLPNSALGSEIHLNITIDGKACGGTGEFARLVLDAYGQVDELDDESYDQIVVSKDEYNDMDENDKDMATFAENGIYSTPDDYGTSYFYRGGLVNNNLIFAGYQWKIIRFTGEGTIRIIYNGECPDNTCVINTTGAATQISTESAFNDFNTYNAYVGYMYGTPNSLGYEEEHANTNNSTIKTILDNWYNESFSDTDKAKIADTIHCADRSFADATTHNIWGWGIGYGTNTSSTMYGALTRTWAKNRPSLKCPKVSDQFTLKTSNIGNKALDYPVGLITADEVAFAGGVYEISNTSFYLYNNQTYWTMTPFAYGSLAENFSFYSGGYIHQYDVTSSWGMGIRPVIALKANVGIKSGDGSSSTPFIIE